MLHDALHNRRRYPLLAPKHCVGPIKRVSLNEFSNIAVRGARRLRAASNVPGPDGASPTDDVHMPAPPHQPCERDNAPAAPAHGHTAPHDSSRSLDAVSVSRNVPRTAASHDAVTLHDEASTSASAPAAATAGQAKAQPSGSSRPAGPALPLRAALVPLYQLLLGLLGLMRGWLQYILVRAGVGTAVSLLVLHLLLNKVAVPLCNRSYLPGLLQQAQAATLREVAADGVSSISLTGLLGIGPLVRIQQLAVGPGPLEKSSALIPEVTVSVLPGASIARGQLLLQINVRSPRARIVQGANFSWLGYPMDTVPSTRDLLPGLTQQQEQEQRKNGLLDGSSSATRREQLGPGVVVSASSSRQEITSSGGAWPADKAAAGDSATHQHRGPPFAAVPSTSRRSGRSRQRGQQQQPHTPPAPDTTADGVVNCMNEEQQWLSERRLSHTAASTSNNNVQLQQQPARLPSHIEDGQQQPQRQHGQPSSPTVRVSKDNDGEACCPQTHSGVASTAAPSAQAMDHQLGTIAGRTLAVPQLVLPSAGVSSPHAAAGSSAVVSVDEVESESVDSSPAEANADLAASSGGSSSEDDRQHNPLDYEDEADSTTSEGSCSDEAEGVQAAEHHRLRVLHPPGSSGLSVGGAMSAVTGLNQQQRQQAATANILSALYCHLHSRFQRLSAALLHSVSNAAKRAVTSTARQLSKAIKVPAPALHSVTLSDGQLAVKVHGEPIDRHVNKVDVTLTLGPEYRWMEMRVEGDAAPRHPASIKCTQVNLNAKRHLRHVTPGAAAATRLRKFACDVLIPQPAPMPAAAAVAALNSTATPADTAGSLLGSGVAGGGGMDAPSGPEDELKHSISATTDTNSNNNRQEAVVAQAVGSSGSSGPPDQHPGPAPAETAERTSRNSSSFPIDTLNISCGQQHLPSRVSFLLPEELQGAPPVTDMPHTGGGHLSVHVVHQRSQQPGNRDNLFVSVGGRALSAPLIERLLELPMDINAGTVDGEIQIAANDDASWVFPSVTGKLRCKDVDIHFWDAPDDVTGADMDLLFERDRVYLHKATGSFGAIPLSVSGDLDLSPQAGQYRLQAAVGPVEVNSLRATLGVRPVPFPIAGALRGVLHLTGPLEKPIFSGSASAVRPPPALLVGVEASPALAALLQDPAAVAAYDRVATTAANGVFTLDTATEMFVLHSAQAVPAGGGLIQAAGKMWVAAAAESDPRAIVMEAGASGLNAATLALGYISDTTAAEAGSAAADAAGSNPAAVLSGVGLLNVRGSLSGSHVAPTTRLEWAAPSSGITGSAVLSPTSATVSSSGLGFSIKASATTSNPTAEQARNANTQAEATFYGSPRVEAFQLEGNISGVDLLPLTTAATAGASAKAESGGNSSVSMVDAGPAMVDGSPLRMRVTGGLRLAAMRDNSEAARRQAGLAPTATGGDLGYLFTGPVVLDGLRVNQLQLCRQLSGDVSLTQPRLLLRGRGTGRSGDELLELDLALPTAPAHAAGPGPDGLVPSNLYYPPGFAPAARQQLISTSLNSSGPSVRSSTDVAGNQAEVGEGGGGDGGDEWPDQQPSWAAECGGVVDSSTSPAVTAEAQRVSHVLLRRGDLHFSSTVNSVGSVFGAALEHLPLDELELGSLRGLLVSAVLDVDLTAAAGRLAATLAAPRFSGITGSSFTASARWERDVVLLEQAVLTQPSSKYQVAAEYVLPPGFVMPNSISEAQQVATAASAIAQVDSPLASAGNAQPQQQDQPADSEGHQQTESGRWRVQLVVPHATVEELLPAGQLLRQASRSAGTDYHKAKANFLGGLAGAAISAGEEFSSQVAALAEAAASAAAVAAATSKPSPSSSSSITAGLPSLPGLQELRGSWSGRLVAVSGGSSTGATAAPQLEYDLSGTAWKAGPYTLDKVLLRGSADAAEGINLEELKLVVGSATLSAKGAMLGRQQDASFALTDFPAVLLQPLFSALPALEHAVPALDMRAAGAGGKPLSNSSSVFAANNSTALSGLSSRLESSLLALGMRLPGSLRGDEEVDPLQPFLGSPVSGLLNIRGALGGSASIPTGVLHIQLVDGALGRQKLARAVASLALNTEQRLACELELMPAESHGHIRLSGSVGLAGAQAQQTAPAAGTLSQGSQQQAASAVGRVGSSNKAAGSGGKKRRKHQQQPRQSDGLSPGSGAGTSVPTEPEVELALNVKDGGVALLTGLAPGLTWGGGSAAIELAAVGPAASPVITGTAAFSKGSLTTSFLKHPVSQLTGSLAVDGQQLVVSGLEAKVGSKGAVMLRGNLPLTSAPVAGNGSSSKARKSATAADGLTVGLSSIELRVRNMYSGIFDASVAISSSLSAPEICGELTFSKGTAYLVPPAAAGSTTVAAGAADTGASVAPSSRELGQAELVSTAFSALKAGRVRAALDHKHQNPSSRAPPHATQTAAHTWQQATPGEGTTASTTIGSAGSNASAGTQPQVHLNGLELVLGPELRAVFPVVLNVGLSGRLRLTGNPAELEGLLPTGTLKLEGGVLNLVATQFRLEREHPNTITFTPEAGLDPTLQLAMSSNELRAVISGRASTWQENLSLTATGPAAAASGAPAAGMGAAAGVGSSTSGLGSGGRDVMPGLEGLAGDPLSGRVVARVFEGRLAEALLAEDGSLSLATLAGSTLGSLLPKIETQGQLGKARWRLVSAPSLPGLLSSADPQAATSTGGSGSTTASDAGPRLLRSLALGTEVELALGGSLVAALSHNMSAAASDGGGEPGTEIRLSLAISRQLRLLVQQRGLRLQPSILVQYNSEGRPGLDSSQ